MSILLVLLAVLAAVSLPVTYLIEWKYGYGKLLKAVHIILAALGLFLTILDVIFFDIKISSVSDGVRVWAEDFFYGYGNAVVPVMLLIMGILAVAALIDHKLRCIRKTVTALLSVVAVLSALFMASLASDGQFAVDLYIRMLAPGLGLLPHLVPLCERRKKSD